MFRFREEYLHIVLCTTCSTPETGYKVTAYQVKPDVKLHGVLLPLPFN